MEFLLEVKDGDELPADGRACPGRGGEVGGGQPAQPEHPQRDQREALPAFDGDEGGQQDYGRNAGRPVLPGQGVYEQQYTAGDSGCACTVEAAGRRAGSLTARQRQRRGHQERNPRDRCSSAVTIADEGCRRLAEAEASIPEFLENTFRRLTPAERDQLRILLGKLLRLPD